jgi:hypothetical protein
LIEATSPVTYSAFRASREERPIFRPDAFPIQLSAPTSDVIRIVEQVPAADRQVNTKEVKAITLIATVLVTALEPKVVNRELEIETHRPKKSRMSEFREHAMSADDCRLDQLIGRLPRCLCSTVHIPSLAQDSNGPIADLWRGSWVPAIVGFWMLPAGPALLADDVQMLRSCRSRIPDWIEHRRPHWLSRGSRLQ